MNITPINMPDAGNMSGEIITRQRINIIENIIYISLEKKDGPSIIESYSSGLTYVKELTDMKKLVIEKAKGPRYSVSCIGQGTIDYYIHYEIRDTIIAVVIAKVNYSQRDAFNILHGLFSAYNSFTDKINNLFK
jgi:hypothetical protein